MTKLLEEAIEKLKVLAPEDQDAMAARILLELTDDQDWNDSFHATTDERWRSMAVKVRADIAVAKSDS